MILFQMVLECLPAVTNLSACATLGFFLIATPCLKMEVLRVLVTLPIVLAAKGLAAGHERAAVWPRVTLHVFSIEVSK